MHASETSNRRRPFAGHPQQVRRLRVGGGTPGGDWQATGGRPASPRPDPARLTLPKAREPTSVAPGDGNLRQATKIRPDTGPTDRRRILAAVLSALVPGLGQAYNRRRRLALWLFVPFAIVAALAVLAVWAIPGAAAPRHARSSRATSTAARRSTWSSSPGGWSPLGPGVLRHPVRAPAGAASAWSGWPWSSLVDDRAPRRRPVRRRRSPESTFAEVFDGDVLGARSDARAGPVPGLRTSGSTSCSSGSTPGRGRDHALTDSLIVVSLDPVGKSVSMASLPRDLVNVPLGDGRTFAPKLNSLLSYATAHPKDFPAGGMRTLENAVGALLGIPIHYYATVDLAGFAKMVDAVGGVDVDVKTRARRPEVPRLRDRRAAGRHVEVGHTTSTAPTRSPTPGSAGPSGQTDFTRQARQQEILLALRAKVVKGDALFSLPSLLEAVGETIATDLPPERLPDLAVLAGEIPAKRIVRVVVRYPLVHPAKPGQNKYGAVQLPDIDRILAMAAGAVPGARDGAEALDPEGCAAAEPRARRRARRRPRAADRRRPGVGPDGPSPSAASRAAIRRAARARCEIRCFSAAVHSPSVRPPGGSLAGSKIGS